MTPGETRWWQYNLPRTYSAARAMFLSDPRILNDPRLGRRREWERWIDAAKEADPVTLEDFVRVLENLPTL